MKKKLIIIHTVAAILILALLIYAFGFRQPIKKDVVASEDCKIIENSYFKDICYLQLSIKNEKESDCINIKDNNVKDLCYIELSKIKKDKILCGFINDTYYNKPKCFAELQMIGIN